MLGLLLLRLSSAAAVFCAAAGGVLLFFPTCGAASRLLEQVPPVVASRPRGADEEIVEDSTSGWSNESLDADDGPDDFDEFDSTIEAVSIASSKPKESSPRSWRDGFMGDSLSCCCKKGACGDPSSNKAMGARRFPARYHKDINMCCKEKPLCKPADTFNNAEDVRRCVPPVGDGRVHVCRARPDTHAAHKFIDIGDSGCLALLTHNLGGVYDGTFLNVESANSYAERDCPFADLPYASYAELAENRARRALLGTFANYKPMAWTDVMMTCVYWNSSKATEGSWSKQGFVPENSTWWAWEINVFFLGQGLSLDEISLQRPEVKAFYCSTLRLLPLMWRRVGFRSAGLTEEETGVTYPYTQRGAVAKRGTVDTIVCSFYRVMSSEESARARRVLRALLPIYGLHVFAATKHGMRKKALQYTMGMFPPATFAKEVALACQTFDDLAWVKVAKFPNLLNTQVAKRDSGRCRRRWPCAYTSGRCAEEKATCNCACYKAVCWFFVADFHAALRDAEKKSLRCDRPLASPHR